MCTTGPTNPFHGAISFDNIGLAWVAIFLVISLEGWTDVMYFVQVFPSSTQSAFWFSDSPYLGVVGSDPVLAQDAHSFWNWIYFVMLIVIGSFFMINLCLVVIATQFRCFVNDIQTRRAEKIRKPNIL